MGSGGPPGPLKGLVPNAGGPPSQVGPRTCFVRAPKRGFFFRAPPPLVCGTSPSPKRPGAVSVTRPPPSRKILSALPPWVFEHCPPPLPAFQLNFSRSDVADWNRCPPPHPPFPICQTKPRPHRVFPPGPPPPPPPSPPFRWPAGALGPRPFGGVRAPLGGVSPPLPPAPAGALRFGGPRRPPGTLGPLGRSSGKRGPGRALQ